jgi:DNA-directed RNA polymerase subunit RPC12/RpoP
MYICVDCRKEMLCDKNGVGANFGGGHVYAGDRFKCPDCGKMILATNSQSIYDKNLSTQDEYLNMN